MEGNAAFPVTAKDSRFLRLLIVTSLSSLMALFLRLIIETEASAAGVLLCRCRPGFSVNQQRTGTFRENPQIVFFPARSGKEEDCCRERVQAQLSLCTLEVVVKAAFVEVLS